MSNNKKEEKVFKEQTFLKLIQLMSKTLIKSQYCLNSEPFESNL